MENYKKLIQDYILAKYLEGRKTIKASEIGKLLRCDYSGDNALFLSYQTRADINNALTQLQKEHYVTLKVIKNPSILIYNLILISESMDKLCSSSGFIPKHQAEEKIINMLKETQYTKITSYIDALIYSPFSVHSIFQYKNGQFTDIDMSDGLNALKGAEYLLSKDPSDIQMVRNVSKKLFNNSKRFQNIENKILTVLMNSTPSGIQEASPGKKLYEYFGVVNNPFFIEFHGKFRIEMNIYDNEWFTLNSLDKQLLDQIADIQGNIITIENRTTYFDYHNDHDLVIYTGGFPSSVITDFLHKIAMRHPEKSFYHWSDIDGGGFYIFSYLQKNVTASYRPMNMDIKSLDRYRKYCEPLTVEDKKRISRFLQDTFFAETAKYMIKNNIKLEQEAFYT